MTAAFYPVRVALLCAGLIALGAAAVRAEGVSWLSNYDVARREAHDKNLPLVIDFSTENCVYCRKLDSTTFRDPAVVKLLSEHFVALHLHVAGPGKEADLAQKLGIQGYPTLIFADANGKMLDRQDGYVAPAEFAQMAQRVLANLPSADAVAQAVRLTAPPSENADPGADRTRHADRLLALAQADFHDQHFLGCLERCKVLRADYSDLPQATEAQRLEDKIRGDPDELRLACDGLTDRLGEMYLDLAEAFVRKDQPQRAVLCLEWVLQACPGTPQADAAKGRLAQIRDRVARPPEHGPAQ